MAIALHFDPPDGMTAALYDEAIARLDKAGAGAPAGRRYHVCFGPDDRLQVVDVWDDEASFAAFGETLLPILAEIGLDPGQPVPLPVRNVIVG